MTGFIGRVKLCLSKKDFVMPSLQLDLPLDVTAEEARLLLSVKLWETGRLSLGQAAEFSGYSQRAFMEVLSNLGLSIFRYDPDDLEREMKL